MSIFDSAFGIEQFSKYVRGISNLNGIKNYEQPSKQQIKKL